MPTEAPMKSDAPSQAAAAAGMLSFLGEPVFWVEGERDEDGFFVARLPELNLLATAHEPAEAAQKLGNQILELVQFLNEEVDDRTEAEECQLHLILDRIGPPLLKYHRRRVPAVLAQRIGRLFHRSLEWGLAPSTPDASRHALGV